ncbi:hypothetical protein PTKIN_Ptkin13bG0001800 [Pterospermum kingtungense]
MSMINKHREPSRLPGKTEAGLDKISNLPGNVIDQILSYLPIRDAVRSSVLSRKWRYKWATIPNLVFEDQYLNASSQDQTFIENKLVNIIDHVLLLHKGPIHKFKLSHRDLLGVTDIDRWILFISRSSIKEFILEIWKGQLYKPPSCLFDCQNLIHLELFNCLLKPPLAFKGFKNLKSLDLQHITIVQDVFENLISSCPLLEKLTLMNFTGITHLNINAPNLQFFDIGGIFDDVSFQNTFHLAMVSIDLYVNIDINENVAPDSSSKLLRFFVNLPHIRRLEVQSFFLKARPKEQTSVERSNNFWENDHWSSVFGHLRLVKVSGISGVKLEMDFIKFLLSNSPVLERLTVKPASQDGEWELMKELLRFRRASIFAEVIYLDP